MPIDYADYHPQWREISRQIRDQAGNRCETCGVPNGAYVVRDRSRSERWREVSGMEIEAATFDGEHVTRIVLTVHHRCECDKRVCRDPSHLVCLCQKHHLAEDMEHHQQNAATTRRLRRIGRGQQELMTA